MTFFTHSRSFRRKKDELQVLVQAGTRKKPTGVSSFAQNQKRSSVQQRNWATGDGLFLPALRSSIAFSTAHFQSSLHPYISPFTLLPISSLTCPMHRPTIFLLLLSVSLPTSSLASSTCRDKDEVAVQTLMPNSNGCSKPPGMEVGGEEVSDRFSFSPRSG